MKRFLVVPLAAALCVPAHALEPFKPASTAAPKPFKPVPVTPAKAVEIFGAASAPLWSTDPLPGSTVPGPTDIFSLAPVDGKPALTLLTGKFTPAITTVRATLPEGSDGDAWLKTKANYAAFDVKADAPLSLSFHLLKRGKTPGTYKSAFSIGTQWQHVVIPVEDFDLKAFNGVMGIALRVSGNAVDTKAYIANLTVGTAPYNDLTFASRRLSISLKGDWHFAPDAENKGVAQKWYAANFDDAAWQTLKTGLSWQDQGVKLAGWGWYRQQIFVPKEFTGTPLVLNLATLPLDDDTYFNGTRVGGWSGEYKYNTWLDRVYTVPPSLIKYGENNSIAMRIWGGNLSFIGNKSGLVKGALTADLDPYGVTMRAPGAAEEQPAALYDISDAQHGQPFEIIFRLPGELATPGSTLQYQLTDFAGLTIKSGTSPLTVSPDGIAKTVVLIDAETSKTIYLRGRVKANLIAFNGDAPIYTGGRDLDRLTFAKRDDQALPALTATTEDTPYGKLRLVDEIDAGTDIGNDLHPYLQSGMGHDQDRQIPGSALNVKVTDILGKKARDSDMGWFAYRIGRGKLKPHTTYLLRIEYPEDKPRFAPIEIQTGQNYMDVGWKNGVGPNDPYDNWPLSKQWQWYDVVVPLDDNTTGAGGTGTASSENGFWVYFMNKVTKERYYAMWSGGPAVGRMKLYEIDPAANAPVIQKPQGLPQRVLSFDAERQPDNDPADFIRYAKLMGYNAVSPVIIKWAFANYAEPVNGFSTVAIDAQNYWSTNPYDPAAGVPAQPAFPGAKSQHVRYLEATKAMGLNYIPRFEYGGSLDLPKDAWAVDPQGQPTKPNRFAPWCGNLLHPATWEDLKRLMDSMVKPYAKDNPQMTGLLWRIRCARMPISYGKSDIELFCKETNTPLPLGGETQWGAWATGEMKVKYDDWWHQKRAQFHAKLVNLLRSYNPAMELYYYNWDEDKFGLIQPDITSWAFVSNVVKSPADGGGRAAYEKERVSRAKLTGADYIETVRTGSFGNTTAAKTNRADYGIRPNLYKDIPGIQIFAPANYLCYADKPDFLNYFRTGDGLAVSNVVSYDEIGARTINPKYEGNMITPGGPAYSMALELLSYFHGDARTLNYTVYTYGRGFADAHRRFAQAFLALPAIDGKVVDNADADTKIRTYASANGTYVGVAYKGYSGKKLTVKLPGLAKPGAVVTDLVTNKPVPATVSGTDLTFTVDSGPVELNSYLVK